MIKVLPNHPLTYLRSCIVLRKYVNYIISFANINNTQGVFDNSK